MASRKQAHMYVSGRRLRETTMLFYGKDPVFTSVVVFLAPHTIFACLPLNLPATVSVSYLTQALASLPTVGWQLLNSPMFPLLVGQSRGTFYTVPPGSAVSLSPRCPQWSPAHYWLLLYMAPTSLSHSPTCGNHLPNKLPTPKPHFQFCFHRNTNQDTYSGVQVPRQSCKMPVGFTFYR